MWCIDCPFVCEGTSLYPDIQLQAMHKVVNTVSVLIDICFVQSYRRVFSKTMVRF